MALQAIVQRRAGTGFGMRIVRRNMLAPTLPSPGKPG